MRFPAHQTTFIITIHGHPRPSIARAMRVVLPLKSAGHIRLQDSGFRSVPRHKPQRFISRRLPRGGRLQILRNENYAYILFPIRSPIFPSTLMIRELLTLHREPRPAHYRFPELDIGCRRDSCCVNDLRME